MGGLTYTTGEGGNNSTIAVFDLEGHPHLKSVYLLLYFLISIFGLYGISHLFLSVHYPTVLPLLRQGPGARRFSWRTRLAYYTDCASVFRDAYENFSKQKKTVTIPGLGVRREIILPQSSFQWLMSQSETSLSVSEAFVEINCTNYSLGDDKYVRDNWQGALVKSHLTAVLDNLKVVLAEELEHAFDSRFGTDSESWKEIDLFDTVRLIVAQAASRFTTGLQLCRDEEYLNTVLYINQGCVNIAGMVAACPKIIQPIIGHLASIPMRLKLRRMEQMFKQTYEKRRALVLNSSHQRASPASKSSASSSSEPQDYLQMMMNFAHEARPSEFSSLPIMTRRLAAANFGSIHQTTIQVTNILLNIIGSNPTHDTIHLLRREFQSVLGPDPAFSLASTWTKARVAAMYKADSVARETLRLHSFGNRAVFRKLLVDGIITPDGIPLPKGSIVSFMGYPPQTDEAVYQNAEMFDPFRFSRVREQQQQRTLVETNLDKTSNISVVKEKEMTTGGKEDVSASSQAVLNTSFVSTSAHFLPFGHGRHSCPGRFLVDVEFKMIMLYVLSRYDVKFPNEYQGERPKNRWVAEAVLPPDGVKILIKRKKVATIDTD